MNRRIRLGLVVLILVIGGGIVEHAAGPSTLSERVGAIMARPVFKHALFGIEFYSLDTNTPIYTVNADKLFVPGSTTKLITMGSALQILGADYRFHTRVYRAGDVDADGTLHGDVVLVASGDTNLSGRIRAGDTLAFENVDHSYGGPDSRGLEGDPLRVIRELASSIASHGIKRIDGRVIVDASLFPEGERDGGTRFVISPVVVNDNAIDVIVQPGAAEGAPVQLKISPVTSYARFVNGAVTGKAGSRETLTIDSDVTRGDGTHVVTLGGSVPADAKPAMVGYRVPEPSRFAEIVLAEALHERGIVAAARDVADKPDIATLSKRVHAGPYRCRTRVAGVCRGGQNYSKGEPEPARERNAVPARRSPEPRRRAACRRKRLQADPEVPRHDRRRRERRIAERRRGRRRALHARLHGPLPRVHGEAADRGDLSRRAADSRQGRDALEYSGEVAGSGRRACEDRDVLGRRHAARSGDGRPAKASRAT